MKLTVTYLSEKFQYLQICFNITFYKGYLRYKTIFSQNVSSEAQFKNFFIS